MKRRAAERQARAEAGRHLAGLGIALEDRDPHEELSRQLATAAALAERVRELVSELEDIHGDEDAASPGPVVG